MAYLSVKQTAALLGVSGQRVRQLLAAGRIEGEPTRSGWRVDLASARRWAAGPRITGRPYPSRSIELSAPAADAIADAATADVSAHAMRKLCVSLGTSPALLHSLTRYGVIAAPVQRERSWWYRPETPAQLIAAAKSQRKGGEALRHSVLWDSGIPLPSSGYALWLQDRAADVRNFAAAMETERARLAEIVATPPISGGTLPDEPDTASDDTEPEASQRDAMRAVLSDDVAEMIAAQSAAHTPTILRGKDTLRTDVITDTVARLLDISSEPWDALADPQQSPTHLDEFVKTLRHTAPSGVYPDMFTPDDAERVTQMMAPASLRAAASKLRYVPQTTMLHMLRPSVLAQIEMLTAAAPLPSQRTLTAVILATSLAMLPDELPSIEETT